MIREIKKYKKYDVGFLYFIFSFFLDIKFKYLK